MRWVALLRGINVGGRRKMPMARVREVAEAAGLGNVRTILATGNVVFDIDDAAGAAHDRLASALAEEFDYDATILVLSQEALAAIAEAFPYPSAPDVHDYVTFFGDSEVCAAAVEEAAALGDAAAGGGQPPSLPCLYWQAPKGHSLDAPQATLLTKPRMARISTTRNANTLRKIASA